MEVDEWESLILLYIYDFEQVVVVVASGHCRFLSLKVFAKRLATTTTSERNIYILILGSLVSN